MDPARQHRTFDTLRPSYDGPDSWLWFVGFSRLGLLTFVALGSSHLLVTGSTLGLFLNGIYLGAAVSSFWYLGTLWKTQRISTTLTWTQVLVDFGVVAATISFTGGQNSFFTVLLVPVILEAGLLMGFVQAFLFAIATCAFMLLQFTWAIPQTADLITHWYNFLIQVVAFFFTAFISGYWNQRVNRMKQFQREILDNMSSGFLIVDAKGLVAAINKSACQILQLDETLIIGRHVDGIIREESGAECPVTTTLRLQKDFSSYEFHTQINEEHSKLLGMSTNRIRDARGEVTGVIATFTDLTEMAHMRQELQKQDRMAVIGELSAELAHEIRNPVTAVRGAVDELQRCNENPDMVKRLAAIAQRESNHLNDIVTAFLDFARNPNRRRESLDIADLIHDTIAQVQRKFHDAADLTVTANLPETPCNVLGDPTQLRQVFMNLAQNAVEAMEEKGALTISVKSGRGPVEIRFDDEGPGIAPDMVARIFEPFYTEKERGVGMGLAICMRIITAHDGTIQAASRPGGGTSMTVRLPAATENGVG